MDRKIKETGAGDGIQTKKYGFDFKILVEGGAKPGQWNASDLLSVAV
jgi:hypothetical protein